MAGVAAIGLSPVARAVESSVLGPMDCVARRGRVSFRLGGIDRWVIDTRAFAGSPDLRVTRTEGLINVALVGARYPGTDLPADMACELRRGLAGWKMTLKLKLGGFRTVVPFERWLTGRATAQSTVKLDARVCSLDSRGCLDLQGKAEAVFRPDWALSINGREVARLRAGDHQVAADAVSVSILRGEDPSLITKPAPRRTLVILRRNEAEWEPRLFTNEMPEDWRVSVGKCAFDAISLELGERKTGLPQRTLLAESIGDDTRLYVRPMDVDGLDLPLRSVRYSTTFGKAENHRALLARFGDEPVWLELDGCAMRLGDSPETPDLEVSRVGDRQATVTCAPALLAFVAPLIGAVTSTARPTKPTNVDVTGRQAPTTRRVPTAPTAPAPKAPAPAPKPPARIIKPDEGRILPKTPEKPPVVMIPFNLKVSVVRPSDLLSLDFEFVNLQYVNGSPPSLTRKDPKAPAYIIVYFPPQNVAERAFFETDPGSNDNEPPTPPPIPSWMSGPSRLVFRVPGNMAAVPYTLAALLDWRQYEPSLVNVALPPPGYQAEKFAAMSRPAAALEKTVFAGKAPVAQRGVFAAKPAKSYDVGQYSLSTAVGGAALKNLLTIRPPDVTETSIEAPYRLMLSPHAGEAWAHSIAEVDGGGRTELWHTRLGVRRNDGRIDEGENPFMTLRAIWSPDYDPKTPPSYTDLTPFRTSLCKRDRCEIVGLSSNFQVAGYDPLPVNAKRFMMTSLGAWIDTHGLWNPKKLTYNTSEWKHTATMGRDHYVKVVTIGYLYPFGHLAVRTTITQRKFEQVGKRIGAYNRQVVFITVLKPVVEYPVPGAGDMILQLPFRRVQCITTVTPNLGKPESSAIAGTNGEAFWPMYGNDDFKFHFVGEDWDGRHVEFEAPVIFTMFSTAFDQTKLGKVNMAYGLDANKNRRKIDLRGQPVAYAESDTPGDTSYETFEVQLAGNAENFTVIAALLEKMKEDDTPPFYPTLFTASVTLPQLKHLVGDSTPVTISYHGAYKINGFSTVQNKGEVFATIKDPIPLNFGGSPDKSCGVASPNMNIGGISRGLGPVGGSADDMASGDFDPTTFFGDARILGTISLKDILTPLTDFGSVAKAGTRIPKLASVPIYESGQSMPSAIETTLNWETSETHDDTVTETFVASANGRQCSLALRAVKRTAMGGGESTQSISGELRDFTLQLVPKIFHLADIRFNYIRFTSENGRKPDVKVDIDKVVFRGPLEFINPLEEFLGGSGFSDPPYLDVTSDGIKAGFTLPIPSIGVGVFSLQNISLDAGLMVPFIGKPVSMRFSFCEKHNPFLLSVSVFGGGGYFALEMDPKGVRTVEGAIEFGGCFSINLGVASGGVYLMAGVGYSRTGDVTKLSGYLRCGGAIEVLGIITVSLEFLMSLDHYSNPSRLYGVATLTVEIEILFFSKSVDLTVERQFAGGGDPTFTDMLTQGDWDNYCDAFAA